LLNSFFCLMSVSLKLLKYPDKTEILQHWGVSFPPEVTPLCTYNCSIKIKYCYCRVLGSWVHDVPKYPTVPNFRHTAHMTYLLPQNGGYRSMRWKSKMTLNQAVVMLLISQYGPMRYPLTFNSNFLYVDNNYGRSISGFSASLTTSNQYYQSVLPLFLILPVETSL
jgi:hypothetical protein